MLEVALRVVPNTESENAQALEMLDKVPGLRVVVEPIPAFVGKYFN